MEGPEQWVLHPDRCAACNHATYLRESWRDGEASTHRRIRSGSVPRVVPVSEFQSGEGYSVGGVPVTVLPAGRGVSYTVRGHGVTVTVSGASDDVFNIARVANDVVQHPIIQGELCVRLGP